MSSSIGAHTYLVYMHETIVFFDWLSNETGTFPSDKRCTKGQQLINLEIPILVRSLKSSKIVLGYYLGGKLFKCCLSVAAHP